MFALLSSAGHCLVESASPILGQVADIGDMVCPKSALNSINVLCPTYTPLILMFWCTHVFPLVQAPWIWRVSIDVLGSIRSCISWLHIFEMFILCPGGIFDVYMCVVLCLWRCHMAATHVFLHMPI